jgi:hypothetical protein
LIENVIGWLEQRKGLTLVFAIAYFFFILFMHDPMVHVSLWVQAQLSLATYNLVVAIVYLVFLAILLALLRKNLFTPIDEPELKLSYFFVTVLFIIVHSRFMFDSNIEVIHSFEYMFLAFLLFPLTRRFGAAIFFTIPFMLIDEWYQYIVLYPETNDYFDLNDIAMDTYGCALMMGILMLMGIKGQPNPKPLWRRSEFIALVIMLFALAIAYKLCIVVAYANQKCNNTLLVMNERLSPEPFLRLHPTHNIMFHVMKPMEGIALFSMLALFYFGMDSFRKKGAYTG